MPIRQVWFEKPGTFDKSFSCMVLRTANFERTPFKANHSRFLEPESIDLYETSTTMTAILLSTAFEICLVRIAH